MISQAPVKLLRRLLAALAILAAAPSLAEPVTVEVMEPYLELHTGPGPGYPATDAVSRGDRITLIKRRTDWIKVRTPAGREGWAALQELQSSLEAARHLELRSREDWTRTPTLGVAAGVIEDDPLIAVTGSYPFNERLALQGDVWRVAGDYSSAWLYAAGLRYRFRPGHRLVPMVSAALAYVDNLPRSTLVDANNESGRALRVGAGLNYQARPDVVLRGALYYLKADFSDQATEDTFSAATLGLEFLF